jgi:hypothetical protein
MDSLLSPPDELRRLLDRVARRLRVRHAIRGAAFGLWAGCALGVVLVLVSKAVWLGVPVIGLASAAVLLGMLAGLLFGLSRRVLSETGLALLVDRGLGTREQIVSALEASLVVGDPDSVDMADLLVQRGRELAQELEPARAVPFVRRNEARPFYFLPLALALVPALTLLPPFRGIADPTRRGMDEEVVEEGEALQERIEEMQQEMEAELPEDIREELAELTEDLQTEQLDAEEALQKLEEMQEQLEEFQEELAEKSPADELQEAAEQLSQSELTQDLADALAEPDLEKAAEAAEKLAEKAGEASAAEQQAAAQAMQQAADALAESNPELSQQMQQAAQQMQQMAENQQSGGSEGMTPEQQQAMQQMAEQLEQMQQSGLSEQMAQDEELMAMSQRLNGALESST